MIFVECPVAIVLFVHVNQFYRYMLQLMSSEKKDGTFGMSLENQPRLDKENGIAIDKSRLHITLYMIASYFKQEFYK